jgi:Arc/MetJ-type ribon-helix-helix transcriptional regulator
MENNQTKQEPKAKQKAPKQHRPLDEFGDQVEKFATKTADSIKKVIERAMSSRNTVLTIRVNDESNKKMNMLVESGLFKSRSESAAFLIEEGIKTQEALFNKIMNKLDKIDKIRDELKTIVSKEMDVTPNKKTKT